MKTLGIITVVGAAISLTSCSDPGPVHMPPNPRANGQDVRPGPGSHMGRGPHPGHNRHMGHGPMARGPHLPHGHMNGGPLGANGVSSGAPQPVSGAQPGQPQAMQGLQGGQRGQHPYGPPSAVHPPGPMFMALDANKDRSLSPEEIEQAATSLIKIDRNQDGVITWDEVLERFPHHDSSPSAANSGRFPAAPPVDPRTANQPATPKG